jgi:exodeoxyribonuclease III
LRILTWNCYLKSTEKCTDLVADLKADIIVLQECFHPLPDTPNCIWIGQNPKKKGLAVIANTEFKLTAMPLAEQAPLYYSPIRVDGPVSFNLLAVWPQHASKYIEGMHKVIDIYHDFLAEKDTVIIGDFNSNAIWDALHGTRSHSALVKRLHDDFNLASSYHWFSGEPHGQESKPTFYLHWKEQKPFHIDYCFAPIEWCKHIQSIHIGKFSEWETISDHRPLLVEFQSTDLY